MNNKFRAIVSDYITETDVNKQVGIKQLSDLPDGDLLIEVEYSSLNYKDTLSANGHRGITRKYPHTPGIDASGVVASSKSNNFKKGDRVLVTGYDLGMNTSGGFSEYIRVPENWAVRLPEEVSTREAMIYGTAGFTAATAIFEFQKNGILPESGKIVVNGATGGVGTMAISMLAKLGYKVSAVSGKAEQKDYLINIGATEVIDRSEIFDKSGKPLLQKRWAAALDNVGGNTLTTLLKSMNDYGVVCNCGMVESTDFSSTVFPFILRAVRLIGIASADTPMKQRLEIWNKIFGEYRLANYPFRIKEVSLDELIEEIELMTLGKQVGRILVNVKK